MDYQVVTKTVGPQLLAAVRRRAFIRDIGRVWKPALDLVWAFLRQNQGLRTDGHNCFLYHHPAHRDEAMDIDFGVQVARRFEGAGEVICTRQVKSQRRLTSAAMTNSAARMTPSTHGLKPAAAPLPGTPGRSTVIGATTRRSLKPKLSTC